jgi:acyl-CoA thioesterase
MTVSRSPSARAAQARRAANLEVDEQFVRRERWRALLVACASCFGGMVVGLALMAWGLHVNDVPLGRSLFFTGLLGGHAIILFVLARFYVVGEQRGWW